VGEGNYVDIGGSFHIIILLKLSENPSVKSEGRGELHLMAVLYGLRLELAG
jgi:hypothetical protein